MTCEYSENYEREMMDNRRRKRPPDNVQQDAAIIFQIGNWQTAAKDGNQWRLRSKEVKAQYELWYHGKDGRNILK